MHSDSREGSPNAGQLQAIRANASQWVTFRILASPFSRPLSLFSVEKNRLPFMGPFFGNCLLKTIILFLFSILFECDCIVFAFDSAQNQTLRLFRFPFVHRSSLLSWLISQNHIITVINKELGNRQGNRFLGFQRLWDSSRKISLFDFPSYVFAWVDQK